METVPTIEEITSWKVGDRLFENKNEAKKELAKLRLLGLLKRRGFSIDGGILDVALTILKDAREVERILSIVTDDD